MDLVHGFSRLALSRWPGMDSRVPRPWHDAFHRSLHPSKLARLLHSIFDITQLPTRSQWKIRLALVAALLQQA